MLLLLCALTKKLYCFSFGNGWISLTLYSIMLLVGGTGPNEGKKALYHCNYCNKDISGKIRIKCTKCPDFDLCVECFSVGAEVTPHKSNHPYRVMVGKFTVTSFCLLFVICTYYCLNRSLILQAPGELVIINLAQHKFLSGIICELLSEFTTNYAHNWTPFLHILGCP